MTNNENELAYRTAVDYWKYTSDQSWTRVNVMLTANSIIIAAIAVILAALTSNNISIIQFFPVLLLINFCLICFGFILCEIWLILIERTHTYFLYYIFTAKEIEKSLQKVNILERGGDLKTRGVTFHKLSTEEKKDLKEPLKFNWFGGITVIKIHRFLIFAFLFVYGSLLAANYFFCVSLFLVQFGLAFFLITIIVSALPVILSLIINKLLKRRNPKEIYITHCSKKKNESLDKAIPVTPRELYTSERIQQFIKRCKQKKVEWAIFSDKYSIVFPDDKIHWYDKDPKEVSEEEFQVLFKTFIKKLSKFDKILYYHIETKEFPLLYTRLIISAQKKGFNVELITDLNQIKKSDYL